MDLILAVLVLGAVIFFGALLSAGNERQRKALDGIREQAALWAVQDLRMKREKLARDVIVDDPMVWLNQVVTKVCGEDLGLILYETFDNPKALVCNSKDGEKVVFSPALSEEIQRLRHNLKGKLSRVGSTHPLTNLPHSVDQTEISILNGGILFDLELSLAWKGITGVELNNTDRLRMYKFS